MRDKNTEIEPKANIDKKSPLMLTLEEYEHDVNSCKIYNKMTGVEVDKKGFIMFDKITEYKLND